jgi:dinuclear metal center YbgI/SA1388 family protein
MTCLTITPATVAEAIERQAQLIVSHHPLPFHPLRTISSETNVGRLLLRLIGRQIAVCSMHTAFDSARAGINQHLAIGLGLQDIRPMETITGEETDLGAGRYGSLGEEISLQEMGERVKSFLDLKSVSLVGSDEQVISRVAIACGSGGSFLTRAIALGCDCFITGETTYHTYLEAESQGIAVVLPGHFSSERFAMASLADYLSDQQVGAEIWTSRTERDPLRTV